MSAIKKIFLRVTDLFSSLKLAVVIMVALAILIAAGTIIESRYNAEIAQKLVYKTWMMDLVMSALALTLISVMVDRWPWKKRHIPFILAHIGILILQLGFVVSGRFGIDGSMRFGLGESNRYVTIPETELQIWSSFDGEKFTKLLDQPVDFYLRPPQENPISIPLPKGGTLAVTDYAPFISPQRRIFASENEQRGSALRFLVKNERVNVTEWLFQNRKSQMVTHNMGPAKFYLGPVPVKVSELAKENAIYLQPLDSETVQYIVTYKDPARAPQQGKVKEGGSFQTGWMGLEFKVLRYFLNAEENLDIKRLNAPTEVSTAAIEVQFNDLKRWVQLNDVAKFFAEDAVYIVTYGHRRVDLGFSLQLVHFEIGRNPGSMRAASYQSRVMTPEGQEVEISMNEPLQYKGLTFYQASFQDGPDGEPIASILSVNQDPGRWLKYLGSLILSLGVIWLFYNKRKSARAQAPESGKL